MNNYITSEDKLLLADTVSEALEVIQTAKTSSELDIIKSKYLGKNSLISKMEKENSKWYKEQKGAKEC